MSFEGGFYVLGVKTIAPRQTVVMDVRALRDEQVPDVYGHTIPLDAKRGQIMWSVRGEDSLAMIGRTEQADLVKGLSSNYACQFCCPNSYYSSRTGPNNPAYVEVNGTLQFTAYETDRNCWGSIMQEHPVNTTLTWASGNTSSATINSSGLATGVADGTTTGVYARWTAYSYAAFAYGCSSNQFVVASPTVTLNVVGVSKVQYQSDPSTFVDITGTLYVLKGTSVTFKAIPNLPTSPFPTGKPVWGGTSGATGTGQTVSVTFNTVSSSTSDFKTVTVTSGNTVTVNVVVYELTGVLTPAVDFNGRSYIVFGIEEDVNLSFTSNPSITAAQASGLTWKITSVGTGFGTLAPMNDGTGMYTAPDTGKTLGLKLEVLDGPSKGGGPTTTIGIVQPSGGSITRAPGTGIKHDQNTWSTGFVGEFHVTPSDVSFFNLLFYEGAAPMVSSGWLSTFNIPHQQSSGSGRIDSSNTVQFTDHIFSGVKSPPPPYGVGEWYWDIPWHFITKSGVRDVVFVTVRQRATSDNAGTAVITKGNASSQSVPSDPTSNF